MAIYIYIAIYGWMVGGKERRNAGKIKMLFVIFIHEAAGVHRRARIARVQSVSRNTDVEKCEIDWIQIFGRMRSNEI